jgi:hypothetical protein
MLSSWATMSLAPHSAQKVACAPLEKPHAVQTQGAGAPHSTQNLAAWGSVAWQLEHSIT